MKRFKWLLIGLVAVGLVMVPLTGCMGIPQSELDALQAELDASKSEFAALQAEHATLIDENTSLKAQSQTAQSDLTNLQENYDAVNEELSEIKEVYPPRDFSSVSELEEWVSRHIQTKSTYLEGTFRSALKVQAAGLEDGYLISVMYDEDDTDPTWGWIFNAALVNGALYFWDPELDEIYSGYADLFVR